MDLLLICRDARADAVVGNVMLALRTRKAGHDVAIIFSGEALLGLCDASFPWPRGFWAQSVRWTLADKAKEAGLPVVGRGQWRALDVRGVLAQAQEAGVGLLACPVWTPLLDVSNKLPGGVGTLEIDEALALMSQTETVIGSF